MTTRFYCYIIKKVLNISDTGDVSTGKNPFIITARPSNHRVPSTSNINDIFTIVINRRKSSSSIPSSPGLIGSKILQSAVPVFSRVSYCQSKTIRRTKSQIGLTCGFDCFSRQYSNVCSCLSLLLICQRLFCI